MTQIVYTTGMENSPYPIVHRSQWRINANGSVGTLTLQSTDNLTLTGSVIFDDAPRKDMIQGGWDDVGRRISFTRTLPDGTLQFFEGFLGDIRAAQLIFAGKLTDSVNPQGVSGWAAFSPILII